MTLTPGATTPGEIVRSPTKVASRSASSALALPLSPAGNAVLATVERVAALRDAVQAQLEAVQRDRLAGDEAAGAVDRRQRAGRVDQAVAEVADVVGEGDRRGQVRVDRRARPRASEAIAAVPVLAAATDAVTGAAAAMPFGSSSARTIDRVAGETGWSRKRSRAAGAGAAMSMRKPSTTLPSLTRLRACRR